MEIWVFIFSEIQYNGSAKLCEVIFVCVLERFIENMQNGIGFDDLAEVSYNYMTKV